MDILSKRWVRRARILFAWKPLSRKKKIALVLCILLFLLLCFYIRFLYLSTVVMLVNKEPITRAALDEQIEHEESFLDWQKRVQPVQPTSEKSVAVQAEEAIIYATLLNQYAKDHEIHIPDATIEQRYTRAYQSLGTEQEYLNKIKEIYHIDKAGLFLKIKQEFLEEAIREKTHMQQKDLPGYLRKHAKVEIFL